MLEGTECGGERQSGARLQGSGGERRWEHPAVTPGGVRQAANDKELAESLEQR